LSGEVVEAHLQTNIPQTKRKDKWETFLRQISDVAFDRMSVCHLRVTTVAILALTPFIYFRNGQQKWQGEDSERGEEGRSCKEAGENRKGDEGEAEEGGSKEREGQ